MERRRRPGDLEMASTLLYGCLLKAGSVACQFSGRRSWDKKVEQDIWCRERYPRPRI
jgi:hypothetical protein